MAVESRASLGACGNIMMPLRNYKGIVIILLTLLFVIPLYRLGDYSTDDYYKTYISDPLTRYLGGEVYNNTLYGEGTDVVHPSWNFSTPCEGFPNTDGILLVMKTGATESYDKLPTHLLTHMQCLPDFLIFSDLEQQMGRYHLYDALDEVDPHLIKVMNEFDLYKAQQSCPISKKDCTSDIGGGWDLDKYKFIHMIIKTWRMRPGQKWYVFAEADTYVFWHNLVHFLRERLGPKKDSYIGSVAVISDYPFAHGGSGYIISGDLVKKIAEEPDMAKKYDRRAGRECCGDFLVALAAGDMGVKVKNMHPHFNGEKPNTLPYGPGQWCEPLFTMHHLNAEEIAAVWQYEQTRTHRDFIQIRDMYHTFMAPEMVDRRDDWDNYSDDVCYLDPEEKFQEDAPEHEKSRQREQADKTPIERRAHESPEDCAKVCMASKLDISVAEYDSLDNDEDRNQLILRKYEKKVADNPRSRDDRDCFQWRYQKGICCTSRSFRLGTPKHEDDDDKKFKSGWFERGIDDWIKAKGDCKEPEWRSPS